MLDATVAARMIEMCQKFDRLLEIAESAAGRENPDRSLTTKEAAAFLGIHPKELLRYANSGLPHIENMGRGWRFLKKDLIEFRDKFVHRQSPIRRLSIGS